MRDSFDGTRKEYIKRIHEVLDFIEKNLNSDLSLHLLAQKAHYSPYHFHRIFSTIIGEKLNQYINRKRIERIASILLTDSKQSLKKLAYSYGFNSESSFSRTFKKYYGISPTKFRSEGKATISKIGIEDFTTEKYICDIEKINDWINMNAQITVTELQEINLAGITHIGEFEKMGSFYKRLMNWGHEKDVLNTSNFKTITIYHDNPNVTQLSKVRYSACITVDKNMESDGEIMPLKIHTGIYAVGHFEIDAQEISTAWKNMTIWVMENGYEFKDGDFFELYHNDHRDHPEQKFILDICMPLERTDTIKLDKVKTVNLSSFTEKNRECDIKVDYHELVSYMKELRAFYHKEYDAHFKLGVLNQKSPDFTYFSITPESLKKHKLKFVIILNHRIPSLTICLSGQNKSIRRKYWEIFNGSDWDKYHLAESITNSLLIIDHTMVANPDFKDKRTLTTQIETEALTFMQELTELLE